MSDYRFTGQSCDGGDDNFDLSNAQFIIMGDTEWLPDGTVESWWRDGIYGPVHVKHTIPDPRRSE